MASTLVASPRAMAPTMVLTPTSKQAQTMAPRSSCAAPGRPASSIGGASVSKAATTWARATSTGSGAAKSAAMTRPSSTSATRAVPRARSSTSDDLGLRARRRAPRAKAAQSSGGAASASSTRQPKGVGRDRPVVGGGRRPAAADGEAVPGGGVAADLGAAHLERGLAGVRVGRGRAPGHRRGRGEANSPDQCIGTKTAAGLDPVGDEGADERAAVRARHLDEVGGGRCRAPRRPSGGSRRRARRCAGRGAAARPVRVIVCHWSRTRPVLSVSGKRGGALRGRGLARPRSSGRGRRG